MEGLLQLQFLGPFDVVSDGFHVDAWSWNFQLIKNLNGLEFQDSAAAKPGKHKILGHLGLGTRCRTKRGWGPFVMKGHRIIPTFPS